MKRKGEFFMAAKPAYNGTVLRQGSSGPDVALIQRWLNSARSTYPNLASVTVDGQYGSATAGAVRNFQTAAGLTRDGSVGINTWNELCATHAAANGEGEIFPGISMRSGHTGATVKSAQTKLQALVPGLAADGRYGAQTQQAVRAYQTVNGLTVDGILGRNTWNSLYDVSGT